MKHSWLAVFLCNQDGKIWLNNTNFFSRKKKITIQCIEDMKEYVSKEHNLNKEKISIINLIYLGKVGEKKWREATGKE